MELYCPELLDLILLGELLKQFIDIYMSLLGPYIKTVVFFVDFFLSIKYIHFCIDRHVSLDPLPLQTGWCHFS